MLGNFGPHRFVLTHNLISEHLNTDMDRDFRGKIYPFTFYEWTVFALLSRQCCPFSNSVIPLVSGGWCIQAVNVFYFSYM